MDRRTFLRAVVASGALTALPRPLAAGAERPPGTVPDLLQYNCGIAPASAVVASTRVVEPFAQALRIPPVLTPTSTVDGIDRYDIRIRAADVPVFEDTTTRMWTYEGTYPGPTIVARRNRPAWVTQHNELDVPQTIHLHGAHVPSRFDGHPNDLILPGRSKEYRYPNTQLPATLWYHDHVHHGTARNVYQGLAGMYLITDDEEEALRLPSGDLEVPLVLADRSFTEDGQLFHPGHTGAAFFGDTALVNGVPHPTFTVPPVRMRFRVLNGANSRAFQLGLDNGRPLVQIGTDGGLLPGPIERDRLAIWPAERVDLVIDFRGLAGQSVTLLDDFGSWGGLLRFDVVDDGRTDTADVPEALRALPVHTEPTTLRELVLSFDQRHGLWVIDGRAYDPARADQLPRMGDTEVWRLTNASGVEHPIHIHLIMFQVVRRNDDPPRPGDEGLKDTVVVPPGESVDVIMRFENHPGLFVHHCHNLEHEDHDMMSQFKLVDVRRLAGPSRVQTAVAISEATFSPGVPVAFVATAATFPDALAAGPAGAAAGGPLLATDRDQLPASTAAELDRLAPGRIVVLGGPGAVSDAVVQALGAHTTGGVERLAGANRWATAAAISASHAQPGRRVWVASGEGFPDALVGAAAAAAHGGSLLLTARDALPPETAAELDRLAPPSITLLGGTGVVSATVEAELGRYTAGEVVRLAGTNRYATAAATVADAFPGQHDHVLLATGEAFPDALAAAPAAGGAPLLLVPPTGIPDEVAAQLERLAPRRATVLGGVNALPEPVVDALAAFLPDF